MDTLLWIPLLWSDSRLRTRRPAQCLIDSKEEDGETVVKNSMASHHIEGLRALVIANLIASLLDVLAHNPLLKCPRCGSGPSALSGNPVRVSPVVPHNAAHTLSRFFPDAFGISRPNRATSPPGGMSHLHSHLHSLNKLPLKRCHATRRCSSYIVACYTLPINPSLDMSKSQIGIARVPPKEAGISMNLPL